MKWGPGAQGGFQNALMTGLQLGQMAGQQKRARDERNALAAYAKDPNEQNFAGLADVRPDIAIQQRGQMQAQQAKQLEGDLTQRALSGDEDALNQLATVNFDRWKSLDATTRARATEQAKLFGEASLDVLQVPPGPARRERIMTYAQQFPQLADQINDIAFLPPAEQEARLRAIVVEANLTQRLHQMENPVYQAIPEGGTLVNTRDPVAVREFQGQSSGYQEGQTAVNSQTGQRIVFRNGQWVPM